MSNSVINDKNTTAEDKMEVEDEDNKNYDANQIDVEDNDSENKTEAAINDTVSIFMSIL